MIRIPANLWRAEWIKTTKSLFNQILFIIPVALVVAFFIVTGVAAGVAPQRFGAQAQRVLLFPQCLIIIAQVAVVAGQLLAAVFVAQNVGSEYSRDTWKMILPRYGQRLSFLITKIGIALLGMVLALATMVAAGLGLSWFARALLRLPAPASSPMLSSAEILLGVAVLPLPLLLYGSTALLITIATRSAIGGALLSFFGLQALALFSPFYGVLAIVMPYPHLPNIIERWSLRDMETLERVTQGFGYAVSPLASICVVLVYCGLAIFSAGLLFWKRDITNE